MNKIKNEDKNNNVHNTMHIIFLLINQTWLKSKLLKKNIIYILNNMNVPNHVCITNIYNSLFIF